MKKLPENILRVNEDNQVIATPIAAFVSEVVKAYKVKDFKNEEGEVVTLSGDIVRQLIKGHLNDEEGTFEVPEEWSQYAKVSDAIREFVQGHVKAADAQKKQKEAEKDQKIAEKNALKEEKEKEDKMYLESQESFANFIIAQKDKMDKKANELFNNSIKSIALPKTISFNANGMGLNISENATKDDIASATANIFGSLEGVSNSQAALQFAVGDLVNQAIEKKIFRSKGDATSAIALVIQEKLHKKFHSGSVNYYALMAERVAPEDRVVGVATSVFLEVSKMTAPRNKETPKDEQEKLEVKFTEARKEALKKVKDGEIGSVKDVKDFVKKFKTDQGLLTGDTISIGEVYKTLFMALWIDRNLDHVDGVYTFFKSKNSLETYTMSREELTSTLESALNTLQNTVLDKANVPAVIAGKIVKGKGDKTEEQPFYLADPFGKFADWKPEPKKEEPKKEEAKKEEAAK